MRLARALSLTLMLAGCGPPPEPPSILLFVMDTTRADAVSANGAVQGTTPTLDALAAGGVAFDRAYSAAPWTLPSHASLFTGQLPSAHGVDWLHLQAPDDLVMLAERLRDAGYDTWGFSENVWISRGFNMAQGFERFRFRGVLKRGPAVETVLRRWLQRRSGAKPLFLFVNVLDAHWPYKVRGDDPFLPAGVSSEQARLVPQTAAHYLCSDEPRDAELAVLRGLYLGDVRAADSQLASVLQLLRSQGLSENLITIVTSDHGEHFGEHGLFGHQFSVRSELLHVPLVVHGAPGAQPARIDTPVSLVDVFPSILLWAGATSREDLGQELPLESGGGDAGRALVAEYVDPGNAPHTESNLGAGMRRQTDLARAACGAQWRVFGNMRSLIRFPLKLDWFEHYPPALYELQQDPAQQTDLANSRPDATAELLAALAAQSGDRKNRSILHPELPPETLEALKALGYID